MIEFKEHYMIKLFRLVAASSITIAITGQAQEQAQEHLDAVETHQSVDEAAREVAKAAVQAAEEAAKAAMRGDVRTARGGERFAYEATPVEYALVQNRAADYPAALWEEGPTASVGYTLSVNSEGMPTACTVTESSTYDLLDEASCMLLMERAQFDPARDDDGNAIDSEYYGNHYWRKEEPDFGGPMRVHVAYTINADGTSQDCEVIEVSGEISEQMRSTFEREPCPGINRASQAPYRDEDGNPVTKRVELIVQVEASDP